MNVLLTGNGFDLAHKLPTRYIDFINVAEELKKVDTKNCKWIAYILGVRSNLYKTDSWIKECCDTHNGFGRMELNPEKMKELKDGSKRNLWIQYFIENKDGNIGWIDFEKEMQEALDIIDNIITLINNNIANNYIDIKSLRADQIFKALFFKEVFNGSRISGISIKDEYLLHTTLGDSYQVDSDKISSYLSDQLDELIYLLNIYFEDIINPISNSWRRRNIYKQIKEVEFQINFNYTNTAESLYDYPNLKVCYIHGKASNNGENMVLGTRDYKKIKEDCFYNFRKYFQCIQKKSDFSYRDLFKNDENKVFYVWGHSLDDTDGDVLREIFTYSQEDKFIIFFHNDKARYEQIKNLISILGKEVFENYRYAEKIVFEEICKGDIENEVCMG